ncbi:MAG: DNA-directed RNA polymerase subunit H [Candidatus Bathyarchaeota archaeon]|nr:MAG: DNA-directed RNA polymerase subunit H [Candidatus Bathyarchaeota archaeon]
MSKAKSDEERRAELIIKYRKLKVNKKQRTKEQITYFLSRGEEQYVMICLIDTKTIGISYVRDLRDQVEERGAVKGILVGNGKYTYSAKSTAPKLKVELIPPTLPTFDIFEHRLVPKAEIVSEEEKKKFIETYHAQPYQYPWIKADDPVSIILGAEPGDVIRIISESETAGIYESYRYVV